MLAVSSPNGQHPKTADREGIGMKQRFDAVCVGGGVIGLMLACRLAERRLKVAVVDQGSMGKQASWAGAGIIPPPPEPPSPSPFDRLRSVSYHDYSDWAARLNEDTGIDIGLRHTGGIELAIDEADVQSVTSREDSWRRENISFDPIDANQLRQLEPELATQAGWRGHFFPQMAQVRNPRLLQGLIRLCERLHVALIANSAVVDLTDEPRTATVTLRNGDEIETGNVIVTAGAWSAKLLKKVGFDLPVQPVRGEIITYQLEPDLVRRIGLMGKCYYVPRSDGLLLVGATEELAGFDCRNTEQGIAMLSNLAASIFPVVRSMAPAYCWAGLRPGSPFSSPILGRVGDTQHLWVATGHFRHGLQLAPASARLLADWITGSTSFADLDSFSLRADRRGYQHSFHS